MIRVFRHDAAAVRVLAFITASMAAAAVAADVLPVTKQPQIAIDGRGFIGTPVEALAISSTGEFIAAGANKAVRVWKRVGSGATDAQGWELMATLRGYQEPMGYETGKVHALCFSPDDRFLLVGVADNSLAGATRVFDLHDLRQMHGVIPGHLACTRGITFSPSGTHLATWSCDGQVIVYDWQEAKGNATEVFRRSYLEARSVDPEDYAPGKRLIALPKSFSFLDEQNLLFGRGGVPLIFSLRTKAEIPYKSLPVRVKAAAKKIESVKITALRGTARETCPAFLALNNLDNAGSRPWCIRGGMARDGAADPVYYAAAMSVDGQSPVVYAKHSVAPVAIAAATRSPLVASSDMLGHIHLWNSTTGRQLAVLRPGARPIWSLAWDGDSRFTFGDRHYTQAEGYQFNRRGPPTHVLELEQMSIQPLASIDDRRTGLASSPRPEIVTSAKQSGVALTMIRNPIFKDDNVLDHEPFVLQLTDRSGKSEILNAYDGNKTVPPNFQVPHESLQEVSAYAFIDDPGLPDRATRFLIGTRKGEIYECELATDAAGNLFPRARREFLGHTTLITSISVSPNCRRFATSSVDGTIRIWPLSPARVLGDIPTKREQTGGCLGCSGGEGFQADTIYHRFDGMPFFDRYRHILAGKYSPGDKVVIGSAKLKPGEDGRFAVVMEEQEMILEASRDLAEPVMSFYFSNDGEWVAWTPEGFFTSSFAGAEHVGFHVNHERHELAEFFPARAFAEAFERPGLVLATLRDRVAPAAPAAAFEVATLGGSPRGAAEQVDFIAPVFLPPPAPSIISPKEGVVVEASRPLRVEIEVRYHPERPLRRLAVQIGDTGSRLVSQRTSLETPRPDLVIEKYETVVDTAAKLLTLTAIATHDLGSSRSAPIALVAGATQAVRAQVKPRLFVLAVGVGAYRDPALRLDAAGRDARVFADSFARQRGGYFDEVEVKTLVDESATRADIEDGLDWMARSCDGSADVAIVLLSGHGLVDSANEWYFAPTEVDRGRLARTAVSRADFEKYLRPMRRILIFTDTSRSVLAGPDERGVPAAAGMASPFRSSGTPSFHACAMGNMSRDDSSHGLGVFVKAVLDGMSQRATDANNDGLIQVGELRVFVERRVSSATRGRQMPLFEAPSTVGNLVIGRYTN